MGKINHESTKVRKHEKRHKKKDERPTSNEKRISNGEKKFEGRRHRPNPNINLCSLFFPIQYSMLGVRCSFFSSSLVHPETFLLCVAQSGV